MQEVIRSIIEKLEELQKINYEAYETVTWNNDKIAYINASNAYSNAIDIVKQEAEQYNNGWIPCSERLPEIRQDCLVTVRYTGFLGMHGFWVKTGHMESENDWWGDCAGGEVIAWQPLPSPFKEKE